MPSSRGSRRRLISWAAGAATLAAAVSGTLPARAADSSAPQTGTATAIAGKVDLDVQLLTGLLGALHLGGPSGIDIPLANLALGEADAPNANGDSANFTNSVVRLRDDLIAKLNLPGPEADLIKADAVSGTARVINGPGGYSQAYATVTNLRLFLPLVTLPGASADNGILKIDAVSAQATCVPGQKPSASAKMPTTVLLLGKQIPVPLNGDVKLPIPALGQIELNLSPTTTTDASGASAAVKAQVTVDAVNLVKASGSIVLASAACTTPAVAAAGSGGPTSPGGSTSTGSPGGTTGGTTTSVGGTSTTSAGGGSGSATTTSAAAATSAAAKDGAPAGNGDSALAATGASGSLLPIAGTAAVLVLGGIGLLIFLRRKSASLPPSPPEE
ncbi:MAG: hypothetical protein HOV87_06605 [Catenulispora sp.]|nr:hypothetical protein [Catenulispora sp.]